MKQFWLNIKNFFLTLLTRSERIELAVKVAKALKNFSDSSIDDIIVYVLTVVAPTTSTATSLITSFLKSDLPTILKVLQLMDASDESEDNETNMEAVSAKAKQLGTVNDTTLESLVKKAMADGKLTYSEAKEILTSLN